MGTGDILLGVNPAMDFHPIQNATELNWKETPSLYAFGSCAPLPLLMVSPGRTRLFFTRAFWAKRELHCIFLGKKAIIITSKHGTTIFFSHDNLFLGKLKEDWSEKRA